MPNLTVSLRDPPPNASFPREDTSPSPGGCKPRMEDSRGPEEEEGKALAVQEVVIGEVGIKTPHRGSKCPFS